MALAFIEPLFPIGGARPKRFEEELVAQQRFDWAIEFHPNGVVNDTASI